MVDPMNDWRKQWAPEFLWSMIVISSLLKPVLHSRAIICSTVLDYGYGKIHSKYLEAAVSDV